MLNPNIDSIIYQATVKLEDLAEQIADSRSTRRIAKYLDQAAAIGYYLDAVSYVDYLDEEQVNNILQCLIQVSEIQDYPVTDTLLSLTVPSNGTVITIVGEKGAKGDTGGATDFSSTGINSSSVVDSFAITSAPAAQWEYFVSNSTGQRAGNVIGTWLSNGSLTDSTDFATPDVNGSTSGIEFTVEYSGGNIRLVANITSGTWSISGSRYLIPNNGAGVNVSTSPLIDSHIFVGNSSNLPTDVALTGDIGITNAGVTSISSGVIVNTDVSASAAIAVSKLAALTASKAVATDSSGLLTTGTTTSTELGYVAGVTSAIQTQLDGKIGSVTGAISTVVAVDLTASRAVISNPSGKIAVSGTTSTELGYVSGVTSALQTQINAKEASLGFTPVQQGTGISQLSNTVKLGWSGGALLATVDVSNQGEFLFSSSVDTSLEYTAGHKIRLPNNYIAVQSPDAVQLYTKVINIGDWNMDSTGTTNVAHGLTLSKIRTVSAIIRDDAGTSFYMLGNINGEASFIDLIDGTNVSLTRFSGGFFDNTNYNATSYNRGYITILYTS